jgi:hypothetical protein
MKYLCLVYPSEKFTITPDVSRRFLEFQAATVEAGVFVTSGRLLPADTTTTIRLENGEAVLTDGPFAEIKEQVGGFVLLDCPDLDEAVKWASRIPGLEYGPVEIRPLDPTLQR